MPEEEEDVVLAQRDTQMQNAWDLLEILASTGIFLDLEFHIKDIPCKIGVVSGFPAI